MKRLSLDETWRLCLQMWKWIAKKIKADKNLCVGDLKAEWVKKHDFDEIDSNCFFCEYSAKHPNKKVNCNCPAKKIDKGFHCLKGEYHYEHEPIKFYKKLVKLNEIRLAKKKQK